MFFVFVCVVGKVEAKNWTDEDRAENILANVTNLNEMKI